MTIIIITIDLLIINIIFALMNITIKEIIFSTTNIIITLYIRVIIITVDAIPAIPFLMDFIKVDTN